MQVFAKELCGKQRRGAALLLLFLTVLRAGPFPAPGAQSARPPKTSADRRRNCQSNPWLSGQHWSNIVKPPGRRPRKRCMMISGHKTLSVLDRYNIVSERDIREAGATVERYIADSDKDAFRTPKSGL